MPRTVIAIYDDLYDAQRAIRTLREAARFSETSINLLSRDTEDEELTRRLDGRVEVSEDEEELDVTKAGAEVGAALGAIGGLLVGLGGIFIPGVGPVVAAGPLMGTLIGAVGGAAAGGIIGALVEAGIPETDAHAYAEALRRGSTLVTVDAMDEGQAATAIDVLGRYNPIDLEKRTHRWREEGWSGRYEPHGEPHTRDSNDGQPAESAEAATSTRRFYASYPDTMLGSDWYSRHERMYREHFQGHRPREGTFEDFKTAYRFGARFGADQRFARHDWETIHERLRERWMEQGERERWRNVQQYVRFAWERTREELFGGGVTAQP